jgi:hypothetical protein
VAVDGGYGLIKGAQASSGEEEHSVVRDAAEAAGLELDLCTPENVWDGQVAKRNWMAGHAVLDLTPRDYVLVVDADYRVICSPDLVRHELESNRTADALEVDFWTPIPYGIDVAADAPHAWHERYAGTMFKHSLLFRAWPKMRVVGLHWQYSALKNGQRTALLGHTGNMRFARGVTEEVKSTFVIEHRCFSRSKTTLERNRQYCIDREDKEMSVLGKEL